jgi:hypothetical protein
MQGKDIEGKTAQAVNVICRDKAERGPMPYFTGISLSKRFYKFLNPK